MWAKLYGFTFSSPSHNVFVFMKGSGDASRRCSLSGPSYFQRERVTMSSSKLHLEWMKNTRAPPGLQLMRYRELRQAHNLKRWILRAQNYAIYLARLMCLFMYERLSVHRRLPDHHFSTLIPQLSSFHLSVRVKWKSEVLHFRSFSPFTEQGRTLFAVLDVCRDDGWNRYVPAKHIVSV